jgi:hypothetical protein
MKDKQKKSLAEDSACSCRPSKNKEILFCYQKFSDLLWKKKCSSDRETHLKFVDEGREFAKILRPLEQFIQTVKGQHNVW